VFLNGFVIVLTSHPIYVNIAHFMFSVFIIFLLISGFVVFFSFFVMCANLY
jgi:hypothetical protein